MSEYILQVLRFVNPINSKLAEEFCDDNGIEIKKCHQEFLFKKKEDYNELKQHCRKNKIAFVPDEVNPNI